MLVVEKECGMGRRCVWISEGGYETRQHFPWNFVLNLASKKVYFFLALDLGPSGTVKMFLVGEYHSRGERNWRWALPPLWGFCCVRIV